VLNAAVNRATCSGRPIHTTCTLFSPPLTLGWREFYEAMVRRWARNVAVLGVGTVLVFVLWLLSLGLLPRLSAP